MRGEVNSGHSEMSGLREIIHVYIKFLIRLTFMYARSMWYIIAKILLSNQLLK